ncbi:hypothetical protein V8C37DRAFT_400344 [Trichoderma ceciliae]
MDVESDSCDLISFDRDDDDDDDGVAKVDPFLATVDDYLGERAQGRTDMMGSAMVPQVLDEAHKKQKLDRGPTEPCLLDTALEMGNGQWLMPGLVPYPQQPHDESDIQSGMGNGTLSNNPSYDLAVYDLFHGRDSTWTRKADRPTALDMWDLADGTVSKDAGHD